MTLTMPIIARVRRFLSLSSAYLAQSPPLSAMWQSTQLIPRDAEKNPIVDMNSSAGMPFSICTFLNTCSAGLVSPRVCPRAAATLSMHVRNKIGLLVIATGCRIAMLLVVFRRFRRRAFHLHDVETGPLQPQRQFIQSDPRFRVHLGVVDHNRHLQVIPVHAVVAFLDAHRIAV